MENTKTQDPRIEQIKRQINELQGLLGYSYLDACSFIQAEAAKRGMEDVITFVHHLKMETLEIVD